MTDYLGNGIGAFYFHRQEEAGSGDIYNYYEYIHRVGKVLIMREEVATGNTAYADGGFNADTAWANKESLEYKKISEL
ncbi:MAG: hypothetical protein JW924_03395 [Fusobacteriaceae bacterium]|nr:hypothetical protein [Fusobacteriaceae bacterium]